MQGKGANGMGRISVELEVANNDDLALVQRIDAFGRKPGCERGWRSRGKQTHMTRRRGVQDRPILRDHAVEEPLGERIGDVCGGLRLVRPGQTCHPYAPSSRPVIRVVSLLLAT